MLFRVFLITTKRVAASSYATSESMRFSYIWDMLKAEVYGGNPHQKPTFDISIVEGV
jgi:hypothetical protein